VETREITGGTSGAAIVLTVTTPTRSGLSLGAEVQKDGGAWTPMAVASGAFQAESGLVVDGALYHARARFISPYGVAGAWTDVEDVTVVADTAAPAQPTDFTATAVSGNGALSWTNPTSANFQKLKSTEARPPSSEVQ
jgi:hypothetical protein